MGAMKMTIGEAKDSPALTQATDLCRDTLGRPTADELDHGLDGFLARVAPGQAHPRRLVRWSLAGAAVALGALAIVQIAPALRWRSAAREAPTLTYRIDGGSVLEGGYLRESGHAGMNVTFSEGSRLAFTPGTRGRIRVVDRDTAHVAIERGGGSFQVAHKNHRRWLVDVGPFLVTVTGTTFTASWNPVSEEFSLKLSEGGVVVSGPVSAGEIPLRAGQRLVANLAKVETVISEEVSEPSASEPPNVAPLPTAPPLRPQPSLPSPSPKPVPSAVDKLANEHQWSRKLARGQWDRILEEAKRAGVEATLAEASSEDLFALANAARYRQDFDLARSALLAERRRFPGSSRALEAIYVLGRVEESRDSETAHAIAWYDEYLTRAPTGPLAGEALGRKMTLTDTLEGPARARSLAEEYLRRFPKGNYAGSARELLAP
jgi:ferric-dicitrate binding protein FerR (iron transport regulator)